MLCGNGMAGLHIVFHQTERAIHPFSVFAASLKGHPAGQSLHQVAAFGIEGEPERTFPFPAVGGTPQGAQCHAGSVVSRSVRSVEDREHTAVQLLIVAEEVAFRLFADEPAPAP